MQRPVTLPGRLALVALCAIARPSGAEEPARLEFEGGASQEHLTNGYDDWRSVHAQGSWQDASRRRIDAGLRATERFGLRDREWSLGAGAPLGGGWSASASVAGSPTHRILPRWTGQASLQHELLTGLIGSLQARRSLYGPSGAGGTQGSSGIGLGLEWYAGNWRAALNGSRNRLDGGAHAFASWAELDRYYGEQGPGLVSHVGLLASAGHELENLPGGLIVTPVRGVSLLGLHRIDARWALSWEVSTNRQGDSYRRTGGRLGLRRSF
jgi:YaiO family outer membrane protein